MGAGARSYSRKALAKIVQKKGVLRKKNSSMSLKGLRWKDNDDSVNSDRTQAETAGAKLPAHVAEFA